MSKPIPCNRCGGEGGEQMTVAGIEISLLCDSCERDHEARIKQDESERRETRRITHWRKICPPEYDDTDITHKGLHQSFVRQAMAWDVSSSKGIGFVGPTGEGKTRMLYFALKAAHHAGRRVYAMHHIDFCECAITVAKMANNQDEAMKLSRAKGNMDAMKYADVCLLDDLGKGRATESANEALAALVEYRTAFRRPLLWSSQAGGKWFIERLGDDRGPAVYRRLAEFCKIVKI